VPKDRPENPASGSDAGDPAGGPSGTCPPPTNPATTTYTVCCSWLDAQAYCGDSARLEVTVTPTPPDGSVSVDILHPSTGSSTASLTGNMTGGRMQTLWITKAQTANWRTDRIRFRANVSSIGQSCTSSNEFTFRQRPTTNWSTLNVVHAKTNASLGSVFEYHDARLEANRVHYNVKIRTHGDPFGAAKQTNAKTRIETVWNNGFSGKKFHRTHCQRGRTCDCAFDCCKADFRLDANFPGSGEHLYVRVVHTAPGATVQGSSTAAAGGRPITGTWGDPPRNADSTYAHEIGHILGQFDEYSPPVGGNDPTGVQPVSPPTGQENLMSTSGNTTLFNRHYRWALRYLNDNASGDAYEIIPP
jgi:hypothetical protein